MAKNRHSFNYGDDADGKPIPAPAGHYILREGDFVPGKFQVYTDGKGWERGTIPATNRARVKGNIRAYAVANGSR